MEKDDIVLDAADRKILDLIQSGFPLEKHPYAIIGEAVGLSGTEALERVRSLKKRAIIRRIGANFNSALLGRHSTLCAAKVTEEALPAFIAAVNKIPGVTHNYLRKHAYNVWFTCIGNSKQEVEAILESLERETGVAILNLPAKRMYKIKVDFQILTNR